MEHDSSALFFHYCDLTRTCTLRTTVVLYTSQSTSKYSKRRKRGILMIIVISHAEGRQLPYMAHLSILTWTFDVPQTTACTPTSQFISHITSTLRSVAGRTDEQMNRSITPHCLYMNVLISTNEGIIIISCLSIWGKPLSCKIQYFRTGTNHGMISFVVTHDLIQYVS